MQKIRSFLQLDPQDRRRCLEAMAMLWTVILGLRALGYSRCHRLLLRLLGGRRPKSTAPTGLQTTVDVCVWSLRIAELQNSVSVRIPSGVNSRNAVLA